MRGEGWSNSGAGSQLVGDFTMVKMQNVNIAFVIVGGEEGGNQAEGTFMVRRGCRLIFGVGQPYVDMVTVRPNDNLMIVTMGCCQPQSGAY